jgi:Raf kinase inhibitor-like YbhB/YbcL family protein
MKAMLILLAVVSAWPNVQAGPDQIKVSSPSFNQGENIPVKFTCDGSDTSPPLNIAGIPSAAKAVVLIVEDPDAPGGHFTHWIRWNMDPKTTSLAAGGGAGGVDGKNDFGKTGYGGPCPPSGTHRYYFRVFALDQELKLGAAAGRKELNGAMKGHIVGSGELMGRYGRK